jgi:hypothetical protein
MADAIVFVADLHGGNKFGLWNPDSLLKGGGKLVLSKYQAYMWECWMYSGQVWLPSVCGKLDRILVVDGDAVDGDKKWSALVDDDVTAQVHSSASALDILVPERKETYMLAGTELHVGKGQKWDNLVGELIKAKQEEGTGDFARERLFLTHDGVVMDIAHHISGSIVPSSRMTPLVREYNDAALAVFEDGWPHPTWIIRADKHYYRKIEEKGGSVVDLPGWQYPPPYVQKNTRQPGHDIGLFVLITDQGKAEPHVRTFAWPTPKVEGIGWTAPTNPSQDSPTRSGPPGIQSSEKQSSQPPEVTESGRQRKNLLTSTARRVVASCKSFIDESARGTG